ncbi:hypothetical protein F2Q68_00008989 [Brassica cretica]|uniref:Leucine-rich repeat-containing N-terminal plant-type domain-containing protein n=1 Tax=Brassica cretica TaxID=69181 RepID=A0A8S9KWF7_BRACR|nr:hypothetical protein F2Q68_00008989 [Brassica cretica]
MGGNLLELCGLDLSQNEFSGEIPVELGGLLKLHALNLSRNYLSGEIPRSFSGLKNVESLDLSFNRLHGEIPAQVTELSNLGVFEVSYNNLSGVIPQGGHSSTFDATSYLGNPLLCGKPTNKSCNINNVQGPGNELEDDGNTIDMHDLLSFSFAGYNSLRKLRNLKILDLSSNKFNNSIFRFLNAATTLTNLFLRSNNMGGSLPVKEFRDLTNLELLDLSRNRFNGSIPLQELSDMRKLKALDLSDNEFSGSTELKGKFPL